MSEDIARKLARSFYHYKIGKYGNILEIPPFVLIRNTFSRYDISLSSVTWTDGKTEIKAIWDSHTRLVYSFIRPSRVSQINL